MTKINTIFGQDLIIVNLGLKSMADSVGAQGSKVIHLDWRPPKDGVPRLHITKSGIYIDDANQQVIDRIQRGQPVLVGMGIAKDVVPGMHDRMILHAGPPIEWARMCGPTRGAIMGALIYEGLAQDPLEAEDIAASGEIEFAPCHHHQAVGPMAGVISPRMPVFIIENKTFGNLAYCTQNEGLGKVLRYGGMGPQVYQRLRWMETDLYPALDRALQTIPDGIDIKSLIAQALHMGDEAHNRNRAGTSLFLRTIAPALARTSQDNERLARVIEFMRQFGEGLIVELRRLLPKSLPEYGICHGDLHAGNARLDRGGRLVLFDLDSFGYGWRALDIGVYRVSYDWLGLSQEVRAAKARFWVAFLEGYNEERSLSRAELSAVDLSLPVRHLELMGITMRYWVQHQGIHWITDDYFDQHVAWFKEWAGEYRP